MMKSPTSLIRNWNAVGVMLALSAVFAVVISTISMPGDRATAQTTPDPVEARAKAWWASLKDADSKTQALRVNILLGRGADNVADDAADDTTLGRQLGDPTRTDTDPTTTPAGTELSSIETAQLDYDDQPGGNQDAIKQFVDGLQAAVTGIVVTGVADPAPTTPAATDIYAVGDGLAGGSSTALRGFQSVELWWNHLTCTEARTAVGEDNDAASADDQDTDTTAIFDPEESTVCKATLNDDSSALVSWDLIPYDDLGDAQGMADAVGNAILGLDAAGSPMTADNARAKAWWDSLTARERVNALYGAAATEAGAGDIVANADGDAIVTRAYLASRKYGEIERTTKFVAGSLEPSTDATALSLSAASQDLVDTTKALINDRWAYVYHMGGSNTMNISELVYWWDSLDSTQRRIAVGVDNEPGTGGANTDYVVEWEDLNTVTDGAGTATGKPLEVNVFTHGQAILGQKVLPDVAAWWATLNADQMVYVVYGNPPLRVPYDHDDDTGTLDVTTVTDADKKVFQKPYDMLTGIVPDTDHLPAVTIALLTRHLVDSSVDLNNDGDTTDTAVDHDDDTATPDLDETAYYSAKAIVDAIAMELFDPPTQLPPATRVTIAAADGSRTISENGTTSEGDDNDFDWPYNSANKPANVADWWETTDCRVMRLAVGQDNDYFHTAITAVEGVDANNDGDFEDAGDTAPVAAAPVEESIYCAHFVGSGSPSRAEGDAGVLTMAAQQRVEEVGKALLGLSEPGRPSFNEPADGTPTISGIAQVGAMLNSDGDPITDMDGVGDFSYQWLRDGDPISGATSKTYEVQPADVGKSISVRYSFTDDERYPESRTSAATSIIAGSPGEISRIEGTIRSVTVSAGDEVTLSVDVYGLQNVKDNGLKDAAHIEWSGDGVPSGDDGEGREITYTAPSSPGAYDVKASLSGGYCQPILGDRTDSVAREADCNATIVVNVRRPSQVTTPSEPAQNPPGEIPAILTDADGNQYEVFTPEGGGTFTGEGYSLTAGAGAIPNGEYIGIRVSDEGTASNAGQTHHRFTLGGNQYEVSAVDASNAVISSYVLNSPATACLPLPDALRTNISDLAIVAINPDDTLTILSASVRLGTSGTHVCGNLSSLPATLAVGSEGAPAPIPTPTPEPTPTTPETGGTAPTSNTGLWALLLGTAIATFGTLLVIARRRETARK